MSGNLGSILDFTKFILGTDTTTNTNSSTKGTISNVGTTDVSGLTLSDAKANTTSTTSGYTASDNTVSNTADPGALQALRDLASTLIGNSTDTGKTNGIVSSFIQNAGDALTSVFGQSNQSGLYNSSATTSQVGDVLSRAAANAAQAILGYQTTETSQAAGVLGQILQATGVQRTKGLSQNLQTTGTSSDTVTSTAENQTTTANALQTQNTQTTASSKQSSGFSVICTWMFRQKLLTRERYTVVSADLSMMPSWVNKGYFATVAPLLSYITKHPKGSAAKATIAIFSARTEYVCACYEVPGCKIKSSGWWARSLVAICCAPASFYFLGKELLMAKTEGKVSSHG